MVGVARMKWNRAGDLSTMPGPFTVMVIVATVEREDLSLPLGSLDGDERQVPFTSCLESPVPGDREP